jgi:glucose/arabinose dehydrogenase/mono/diheme cytochrome c family protein
MMQTMICRVAWATATLPVAGLLIASSLFICAPAAPVPAAEPAGQPAAQRPGACPANNGGIALPPGFCATVFADNLGHARHLAVATDGVVYVNTWSGIYYPGQPPPPGGFVVALKDSRGAGHADVIRRFGDGVAEGSAGGTGIAIYNGAVYAEQNDKIVRYRLSPKSIAPKGPAEVVVSGLPLGGDHPMHPFIIDAHGNIFVDSGTATNSCQPRNRMPHVPGASPCTELQTRGGIWRFDANRLGQKFSPAQRYATGIRNGEGMSFDNAGRLFVTQHGRDQLGENWPDLYTPAIGQELPAEEVVQLEENGDYGWPTCYFDGMQKRLVLAPEYGGDGGHAAGVCAQKRAPVAFFPAHWAPNDLLIYDGAQFPPQYRGGAFVAFHGSWNRAPGLQQGYDVVFQPLADGKVSGDYIVFADGFAGAEKAPGRAAFRPTGLALGPDGALFVADDVHGRIWRITYHGGADVPATLVAARTDTAANGRHDARPPVASLPLAPGITRAQLVLGDHIFHGEASGGTCSGCHASDGKGSVVGANLASGGWIWGDGSMKAIARTITQGVPVAKRAIGAMPPLGGADLSAADVTAVAAYVWALGHAPHGQ